jgi:hypothetical protein
LGRFHSPLILLVMSSHAVARRSANLVNSRRIFLLPDSLRMNGGWAAKFQADARKRCVITEVKGCDRLTEGAFPLPPE